MTAPGRVAQDMPAAGSAAQEELQSALAYATTAECELLLGVLQGVRRPIEQVLASRSDLVTPEFADRFALRLRLFHALHDPGEVLTKRAFEFALVAAARAGGRPARVTKSATNPGTDAVIDGVEFSLKTEAAAAIHPQRIKISKLMESAWTKEYESCAQFLDEGVPQIVAHLERYERILMLRAFGRLEDTGWVRYDLVEIPRDLLLQVRHSRPEDCTGPSPKGNIRIAVSYRGRPAYTLLSDGSDQKITISGLETEFCVRHGSWTVRAEAAGGE